MTTVKTATDDPTTAKVDALVVGVAKGPKGLVLAGGSAAVDAAFSGGLLTALTALGATGSANEVTKVASMGTLAAPAVVAVGLGSPDDGFSAETLRKAAGTAVRALTGVKKVASTLALANGDVPMDEDVTAVAEGFLLGGYRFGEYRTADGPSKDPVGAVTLLGVPKKGLAPRAAAVASAVAVVRDLVNTAPRDLPPAEFASRASAFAAEAGLKVEILDEKALAKGAYGGILGVGAGSIRPPRLVRIEHAPAGVTGPTVALVGKGITFDSGGLSLKPPVAMETMKSDMAGAAAVLGTMLAAAALKVPVHVVAYLPMAENMPSGTAIRPSDILTMYGGKTVEVLNTDAEGRLVLADALVRSGEDKPGLVIDIATLTGAQVVALGNRVSAVMGTDAGRNRVVAAAEAAGEEFWPMPLPDSLRAGLDSEIADLQNIGERNAGGMLSAGLFLKEFVPEGAEWAHLDIAGPSYNTGAPYGYTPKGGTGVGVRTMLAVLESVAATGN